MTKMPKHETYCNFCGRIFTASDASRRCCSPDCVQGLVARYRLQQAVRRLPRCDPRKLQARPALLMVLRDAGVAWLTEDRICDLIYGQVAPSARASLRGLVYRTNASLGLLGFHIESILLQGDDTRNGVAYRLVASPEDVADDLEITPSDEVFAVSRGK